MSHRRAPRLIVEVGYLAALAAALAFARLERYEIVAVMLVGWLLVSIFEWGALRARPYYRSGSPPRWYTPRVRQPPPRPLEQFSAGFPAVEAATDAPTWIASPAMLAEWPVAEAEPGAAPALDEQTHVHDVLEVEVAAAVAAEAAPALPDEVEEADEEPAEPEEEAAPPPEAEPAPTPRPPAEPAVAVHAPRVPRTARHRIDPLAADTPKGRRFGRRGVASSGDVEVTDGPPPGRQLPGESRTEE